VKRALLLSFVVAACGGSGAEVEFCEPTEACDCVEGVERDTACVCVGGSTCSILGDSIEFSCDGNADCSLVCGTNCLISCPGTTTCTVDVGDDAIVSCPGTASCDILCRGDCAVDVAGTASAVVRCEAEADGAVCSLTSCSPTSCGGGVYACRTSCP
jgi:hypothetical protein